MKDYIRYKFENFLGKKSNFIYFLIISGLIFALLIMLVEFSLGLIEKDSFFNLWWRRLVKLFEINDDGIGSNKQIVNVLYWIFSVAFSGTIIGFFAAKISNFIEDLKKGTSKVLDKNHYIIIGWNSTIFNVLKEIEIANENQAKPTVLCFNSMDNVEMNNIINLQYKDKSKIRIITRSGNLYSPKDLNRTNMIKSKAVIILDDEVVPDYNIETTILAVRINLQSVKVPVIPQINDYDTYNVFSRVIENNIFPIHKNKILSDITAQTIRNKHISEIVMDFLDYEGDEIYFLSSTEFVGESFSKASLMLIKVTLIGLINELNKVILNPPGDYIISDTDRLVVIAEDDNDKLDVNKDFAISNKFSNNIGAKIKKDEEVLYILVIGWSKLAQEIIEKTISILSSDSKIHFIYNKSFTECSPKIPKDKKIKTKTSHVSNIDENLIQKTIKNDNYDLILIFGYDDVKTSLNSDSTTIMTSILIKSILKDLNLESEIRVILHLNDGSKKELVEDNEYNELIVSDQISSLALTQLSDNPKLWFVFEELFSKSGLKISISNLEEYTCEINNSLKVYDLAILAIKRGQTFIGYISDNNLFLNPNKYQEVKFQKSLEIVYIS